MTVAKKTLLDNIIESIKGVDGRLIKQSGTTKQMISDLNYKVVAPAKSAADNAVRTADAAVASAKVTSDAVNEIASAIAEAKAGADDAISSIQQAVANASSDAAKIRSDVAKVQDEINTAKKANSASVEALKSDITVAKKDLAGVHDSLDQARADVEQNQKLINDSIAKISNDIEQNRNGLATTRNQLTSAQKSIADNRQALNSSVADINSGIEQDRKDLALAQQANADTAKKLDSYTNQSIEQGKTIKKLQADDDSTKLTIADIKGNVSQVQDSVNGLTANLKDANDNLATVKALADSLSATLTDHGKNIASLQATAKKLSSTLGDADGRLSKVEQTAEEQSTTLSTVQGDLSQVKQTADGLVTTLKDAQGDITKVQATAKGLSEQITNAQGVITDLQTDVTGIKATITDHDKNIHTLQADAKSLTDNMSDAKGDISKLQKTAGSVESSLKDASGRLSKVEQTAKEHTSTLSDTQGKLSQVKQTADGLVTTLKDAQGNIDQLQQTAKGTAEQLSNVQGDITALQKDVSGIKLTITDHDKNIHTLQADSKTLKDDMTDAQGNISSLQKTATSLDSEFKDHDGRISKVEQTASTLTNEFSDEQGHLNRVEQTANGTKQTVADHAGYIATLQSDAKMLTSQMSSAQSNISTLQQTASGFRSKVSGMETSLANLSKSVELQTLDSADINNMRTNGHYFVHNLANNPIVSWVYVDVTGNGNDRIRQDVYQDTGNQHYYRRGFWSWWTDWSKGATESEINQLSTAIEQNKNAITLKADQSTVDNLTGEVSQNTAQLKVQADQISSKVSSEDFKTLDSKVGGAIAQIDKNATAINQTNNKISLKADQTEVDNVKGTASQNSSRLDTMANEIKSKVTSTDVDNIVDSKGYATQNYTQSLVTQKADDWNLNLTNLKTDMATVTSVTNLSATVDGIKSTVANKADQSTVTQLSNVIQSKVSSSDFDNLSKSVELQTLDSADINNMRTNGHYFVHNLANNPIVSWVYVDVTGNGNDRIRQDVYQDTGNQHYYRRGFWSWWTDWSKGATESEINQLSDDINLRVTKGDLISQINLQAGTSLIQSDKLVLDAKTTVFTGDAFIPNAAISNISADKIMLGSSTMYDSDGTLNLVNLKDGITSKITVTQGGVDFDGIDKNASIINFASDNNINAFKVTPTGATVTPTLFFERYDQTAGHWLGFSRNKVRNEGLTFHTWDDEGERFFVNCHARFDRNLSATGNIYQGSWDGTAGKPEAGILSIKYGNTIWSGSNYLAIGDNISNSYTNVVAKSFSQQSTLSSKTNIETVDPTDALDLVNRTDIRSYQYKTDVAEGKTKRYTSLIIDDVNDVSKYYTPDEFTNEERTGRDDGSAVGYLFLAVKELTRRIKTLEEKLHG